MVDEKLRKEMVSIAKETARKQLFHMWKEMIEGKQNYIGWELARIAEGAVEQVLRSYGYHIEMPETLLMKKLMEAAALRNMEYVLREKRGRVF